MIDVAQLCDEQDALVAQARESAAARAGRLVECERSLSRLRTAAPSAVLVQRAVDELASSCGFARVLLSRVEAGAWRPWRVNEQVHGEDWFAAWEDSEIPFADLVLEEQLITEHRPAVVLDTSSSHPFFRSGASPSYVVAPISTGGRAVGFFHADHGTDGRLCDDDDRDLLWAFTEGFAHLYERTVLVERLRDQRSRVRRTLWGVDEALQRLVEDEVVLTATPDEEAGPRTPALPVDGGLASLTPREREVLEVLATGASNQDIADRLVLSVGTVKTHVKHVLGKLGARGRAQAIAHYLDNRATPSGG